MDDFIIKQYYLDQTVSRLFCPALMQNTKQLPLHYFQRFFMTENQNMKQKLFKRQDMILIAVILAAAVLLFLGTKIMHKSPAEVIEISVDGKVIETLDLAKDQELTIDGVSGGTNHLIIKDGEAWVSEATCPDRLCVHQGKIHLDGEIIVCLPNKMTAQIKSTK